MDRKWIVLALLFLITPFAALARGVEKHIEGIVCDERGEALPYATVKASTLDDGTFIAGVVTNEEGRFTIEVAAGQLPILLEVSLIGFATEQVECHQLSGLRIVLRESATMLGEVAVTAQRVRHRLVAGGISTAIEDSPLTHLADIYSVLRGVPFVEVEGTSISVTGKGTPIIYINDRLMTDPNQLRNLKPYLIREIEVVTNPGARYSSSTEAVIKIYTKREAGSGLSGELKLDLSHQHRSPLSYQPFAHLNYRVGHWDFFLSARYFDDRTNHSFPKLDTHGKGGDVEWMNSSETLHVEGVQSQEYTFGINYEDEVRSAGFRYRLAGDKEDSWMYSDLTSKKLLPLPISSERYFSKSQTLKPWSTNHRPNLYYLRRWGEWTTQIDLDYYQTAMSQATERASEGVTDAYELRTVENKHGARYQSFGTRIDVQGSLWGGELAIGSEYSWVHNKFYNKVDADLSLIDLDTEQREQLFSLYLEYSRPFAESWHWSAGLRLEHLQNKYIDKGVLDHDKSRTTTDLFPTFSLRGRLWGLNTELSFRSKIDRPTYLQLQPQYLYVSRYEYKMGDPNLKPAIDYSTALTLSKKWLTLLLSHTYSHDCLTPETGLLTDPDTGKVRPYITLFKTVNAPPHHGLSATAVASPEIGWWHPTLTLRVSQLIGYDLWHFEERVTHRKPTLSLALANQLALPWGINIALNIGYTPFGNEDNVEFLSPILTSYGEISKEWLREGQLLTTFSVSNIFNTTHSQRASSRYSVMESTEYIPPRLAFTITYRFNNTKDKYKGTGALSSVIDRM